MVYFDLINKNPNDKQSNFMSNQRLISLLLFEANCHIIQHKHTFSLLSGV